jgi:hypothetical protein
LIPTFFSPLEKVEEKSNQIGNYFTKQGLKKGDSVSLFMENRPEYVCMWLGLCKVRRRPTDWLSHPLLLPQVIIPNLLSLPSIRLV